MPSGSPEVSPQKESEMPTTQERFVAVYPDREAAARVADRLEGEVGVDRRQVHLDDEADLSVSLYSEMREETGQAWKGGPSGIVTKEQAKGSSLSTVVGALVGAVVLLPVGLVPFDAVPLGARLALAALLGAVAGSTVGFVAGGGLGARGPAVPLAAERGVTLSVDRTDDAVRRQLATADVIRIDLVGPDGATLEVVDTEEQHRDGGVVQQMEDKVAQPPGGDWGSVAPDEPRHGEP
jgi:hypothetical protein